VWGGNDDNNIREIQRLNQNDESNYTERVFFCYLQINVKKIRSKSKLTLQNEKIKRFREFV